MNHDSLTTPLLDQVRQKVRFLHYSFSTEKADVFWIKRFILFHGKRHPNEMGTDEIRSFLNYLANRENVAASTQNQALNAINFLYKHVLDRKLEEIGDFHYAKKPRRLPVVLTQQVSPYPNLKQS